MNKKIFINFLRIFATYSQISTNKVENKKLFIEPYGCQMNVADSAVIGSLLGIAGYEA